MVERRRGLGRGLGALIPPAEPGAPRPIDVFFTDPHPGEDGRRGPAARAGTPGGAAGEDDDEADVIDVRARQDDAGVDRRHEKGTSPDDADGEPRSGRDVGATSGVPEGSGLLPVPGLEFLEVPVDHVAPNPRQPRRVFDEDALMELADSVREIGVLQPVVVRRVGGGAPEDDSRYELVMGERRWRATRLAGLATVPAIVRQTRDDALLRDALLENLHRSDLNALEEAAAYQQLLDDFGCTHDQLAQRIGRSRPQISNTIRLLRLPPSVQLRLAAGVLTAGHARALLGLADGGAMERLAQRVVAEGLSVRATEELVSIGVDAEPLPTRARSAAERAPGLDDLAGRLSDRLDTRVSVSMGRRKGRLVVEFAGADDLNRLLTALAPGDPGLGSP